MLLIGSALVLPNFFSSREFVLAATDPALETMCGDLVANGCQNTAPDLCKQNLEKCDTYYQQQSNVLDKDITATKTQKNTLNNAIASLQKKISSLDYQIKQGTLVIKDLTVQLADTTDSITKTTQQIVDMNIKLGALLRSLAEEDKKGYVEIIFTGADLSDYFGNLANMEILGQNVQQILADIKVMKVNLQNQENSLDTEKGTMEQTVQMNVLQKQENDANKKTQQYYLSITDQQYQQQLAQKSDLTQKSAAIKAKLFQLVGVPNAPTFGDALDVAKTVGAMVGIRPAFLLAIISQESAIGKNVGQCVLADATTGAGKRISSGAVLAKVMKPTRDVPPFLIITQALGRDSYKTPVSCPLSVGWGGAMGPAQFIASTWQLFTDRLQSLLGKAGDPWAIKDSFTASALYLSDLGAKAQTASAEASAASRYYGGSSAYARSVARRASCIQDFINSGNMTVDCQNLIF